MTWTSVRSSWTAMTVGILAVVVALTGGIVAGQSGCDDPLRQTADVALPPEDEEKLGEKFKRQIEEDPELELYENERVNEYIDRLGEEAVETAGVNSPEAIEYDFGVIDAPDQINAFAGPGGTIYFYTGLLRQAESEAEVMSVMSHEVAHVTERHIAQQLVAVYGAQSLLEAALGEDPGLISQLVGSVAAQGALLKFSRSQETEADEVGLTYMIEAGYNPSGFISFFEKLQGGPRLPVFLASHPHPENRIENVRERIAGKSFEDATVGEESHREIVEIIESDIDESPDGDAGMNADGGGGADAGM